MLNLANRLGAYPSALLVLALFVAAAVLCAALVKRLAPWLLFERESADFGQVVGSAIGTMFALVFAMVTVAVWQNYDRVSQAVDEEAHCLDNIYQSMEPYPPEVRDPVRTLLRGYLRHVVDREWAAMQAQEMCEDPVARRLVTDVNARIVAHKPASLGELPLQGEVLAQLTRSRNLRQDRLRAGVPYLDTCMWISLAVGSGILMVFLSAWQVSNRKRQYFMAGALGASLGIHFFLMMAYNHPFQGPGAIGPEPFRQLLEKDWVEVHVPSHGAGGEDAPGTLRIRAASVCGASGSSGTAGTPR